MRQDKTILSIFLTLALQFSLQAHSNMLCGDFFKIRDSQSESSKHAALTDFRKTIGDTNFNQTRSISEVYSSLPVLRKTLAELPAGSVVIDLGAGFGVTVASAVIGQNAVPYSAMHSGSMVSTEKIAELAHLNFLGITATPASKMVVPLVGPDGRWEILAGRLFEDIPTEELKQLLKNKNVVAFSNIGVFEYTPTPDLAFEKIHQILPVGGKLFLSKVLLDNVIQEPNGNLISFFEYAEKSGFKLNNIEGNWVIEKTNQPFKKLPLTRIFALGGLPPKAFYRMNHSDLTKKEKSDLDIQFLKNAKFTHYNSIASQIQNLEFYYDPSPTALKISRAEAFSNCLSFEKYAQNMQSESIDQLYPGQLTKAFSYWAIRGFPREAVRYFDAHKDSFALFPEEEIFYHGLRDLLAKEKNSASLQKLATLLSSDVNTLDPNSLTYKILSLLRTPQPINWDLLSDYSELQPHSHTTAFTYLIAGWKRTAAGQAWLKPYLKE